MNLASMQAMEKALDSITKKFAWLQQGQETRYSLVFDMDGKLMTANFYPMNEDGDPIIHESYGDKVVLNSNLSTSQAMEYIKDDAFVLSPSTYNNAVELAPLLVDIGVKFSDSTPIKSPLLNVCFLESGLKFDFFNIDKNVQFKFVSLISKN